MLHISAAVKVPSPSSYMQILKRLTRDCRASLACEILSAIRLAFSSISNSCSRSLW
jgi:hypothetical protein